MKNQFATYEISLKLKELGFNEECLAFFLMRNDLRIKEYKESGNKNSAFYNNTVCSAPLYQQIIDWFREKYNIHILVSGRLIDSPESKVYVWEIYGDFKELPEELYDGINKDYYKAREQAILKAIELIKNK